MGWHSKIHIAGLQTLLLLTVVESFVLLTANMEDVKKLARNFVSDSLVEQIAEFIAKLNTNPVNVSEENEKNIVALYKDTSGERARKVKKRDGNKKYRDEGKNYRVEPKNSYRDVPNYNYRDRPNNNYRDGPNNNYRDGPNNNYRDRPNKNYQDGPYNNYRDERSSNYRNEKTRMPQHRESGYNIKPIWPRHDETTTMETERETNFQWAKDSVEQGTEQQTPRNNHEKKKQAYKEQSRYEVNANILSGKLSDQDERKIEKDDDEIKHMAKNGYVGKLKNAKERYEVFITNPDDNSEELPVTRLNNDKSLLEKMKNKMTQPSRGKNRNRMRLQSADNEPYNKYDTRSAYTVNNYNAGRHGFEQVKYETYNRTEDIEYHNTGDTLAKTIEPVVNTRGPLGGSTGYIERSVTELTTAIERNEFDQYDNKNYPKAEFVATSGPMALPKVSQRSHLDKNVSETITDSEKEKHKKAWF